jgi:hypothetical protein
MFEIPRTTAQSRLSIMVRKGKAILTSKRGITPAGRFVAYRAYRLAP